MLLKHWGIAICDEKLERKSIMHSIIQEPGVCKAGGRFLFITLSSISLYLALSHRHEPH